MKAKAFGLTDVGRRRETNQDSLLVRADLGVFAVADGMGGHAAGEVASRIAIESLKDKLGGESQPVQDPREAADRLADAFHEGNRRICDSVVARGEWRGMGTTIVALIAVGDRAIIAHVGDSRAYRLRAGQLERMTHDHSWVSEQVRLGLLTDEEAHRHPMRNIVTRALGNRTDLAVELREADVRGGDVYLLCSDGLNTMLTDPEILRTLAASKDDPERACRALVDQANSKGGEDNISVIVCTWDLAAKGPPDLGPTSPGRFVSGA
jgi:protein phosphatase